MIKRNIKCESYRDIWNYLSNKSKLNFFILAFLSLTSTLTEIFSIASIVPFMGTLISPEKIFLNPYANKVFQYFGIIDHSEILLPTVLLFITGVILSGILRIYVILFNTTLTSMAGHELSSKIFSSILNQEYERYSYIKSNEYINGLTKQIDIVIFGTLFSGLTLLSSLMMLFGIIIALFCINYKITLACLIILLGSYYFISIVSKKKVENNSKIIDDSQSEIIKIIQESLGSIRELIMYSIQDIYINKYKEKDTLLRQAQSNNNLQGQSPRYIVEMIGITFISIYAYYLSKTNDGFELIPILALFGIAAQRLLPIVQQSYISWIGIVGSRRQLDALLKIISESNKKSINNNTLKNIDIFNIKLKNIFFKYDKSNKNILNNINLEIKKNEIIGIIGSTGSGKSTLLNIIMGLLKPSSGEIIINDLISLRDEYIEQWRKNIGHVPQNVFLVNSSLRENIKFLDNNKQINEEKISEICMNLDLKELLIRENNGENVIGENGSKLSGGQKQRIGIARAIYMGCNILILDEPTSSLDHITEKKVMKSLLQINKDMMIILVSHNKETINYCDYIYKVEESGVYRV